MKDYTQPGFPEYCDFCKRQDNLTKLDYGIFTTMECPDHLTASTKHVRHLTRMKQNYEGFPQKPLDLFMEAVA